MKTKAAVLTDRNVPWEIMELDVRDPKENEVLIRWVGGRPVPLRRAPAPRRHRPRFPIVGGHEGAGIIEKVGPGVTRVKKGDHVVTLVPAGLRPLPLLRDRALRTSATSARRSSTAACPTARSASTTARTSARMCMLGTFSQYASISETRCV